MAGADIAVLVRRFYAEVWNRADVSVIPELFTADCVFRGSLGAERRGHDGLAAYLREVTTALGDYRCEIAALVTEGDQAMARMRFSGVHRGAFLGYAPTGRPVAWDGAAHFTTRDSRITALWVLGDLAALTARLERDGGT